MYITMNAYLLYIHTNRAGCQLLWQLQLTDEDLFQSHQTLNSPDFQTPSQVSGISHDCTSSKVMSSDTKDTSAHKQYTRTEHMQNIQQRTSAK